MSDLHVAILIPTYNEAADIHGTLDAAVAVRGARKEIIVIDDASTDGTPDIALMYAARGVRLIRQPFNRGVAAARNVGLRATAADIVVILNADVLLPPDFIEQLAPHYRAGVDFVVVEARAINANDLYARYVQAYHEAHYAADPAEGKVDWSEGWSCRREIALAIGGFPEEFPGASGEDAIFVKRLVERGYRRVYDPDIVVTHYVPQTTRDFWKQRYGRGRGTAYRRFGYEKAPLHLWPMIRSWLGFVLWWATLVLPLREAARLTKVSPLGWRDFPGMVWALWLDWLGQQVGYWQSYRKIVEVFARSAKPLTM